MTGVDQAAADKVTFRWQEDSGVPGTWALQGFSPSFPAPVAMVWVRFNFMPKAVEVIHSWVHESWRRQGVRTRANEFIFSSLSPDFAERVVTESGSEHGGEAWMKALGYRRHANGYWYVTRAQFARAVRARRC